MFVGLQHVSQRVNRVDEGSNIARDHLWLATFVFTRTPYDPAAPVPGGVSDEGWTTS